MTIDKQTQDQAYYYQHAEHEPYSANLLEDLFGEHNLTSDAEGEEMLTVPRSKVLWRFKFGEDMKIGNDPEVDYWTGYKQAIYDLFGSKCLPDEAKDEAKDTPNVDSSESNVDTLADNVDSLSQNPSENCDKENHISTDDNKPAEPKFKYNVGDKVKYNLDCTVYKIGFIDKGPTAFPYQFENGMWASESELEPYTEPEADNENPSKSTPLTNDNMEEKELNLKEIVDSNFYCGYKECCRNGEGNLPPLKCDKVLCVARVMKPKKWKPAKGEKYWYLNEFMNVTSSFYNDKDFDAYTKVENTNNCFQSFDLAEQAAEAVRKCLEEFHKNHKPHTLIHGDSQSPAERRTV